MDMTREQLLMNLRQIAVRPTVSICKRTDGMFSAQARGQWKHCRGRFVFFTIQQSATSALEAIYRVAQRQRPSSLKKGTGRGQHIQTD